MALIALLALLLFAGVCFLLIVWAQIVFGVLRRLMGHVDNSGMTVPGCEMQSQCVESNFNPGFRRIHLCILGGFVLAYSLLAGLVWGGYYHSFKSILMTNCGPFATAMLDPTREHWKTAWALFPFCAAFLLWGVFCQFIRLPFQRRPGTVALVMWAMGLMIWFDAAIWSYVLAA